MTRISSSGKCVNRPTINTETKVRSGQCRFLIRALRRQMGKSRWDLCESKASVVYVVNFRAARTTQLDSILKKRLRLLEVEAGRLSSV